MPLTRQDRLERDIGSHFGDRLLTLVGDTLDTCRRVQLPQTDSVNLVMFYMISGSVKIASRLGMNRAQFVRVCGLIWDDTSKGG